MNNWHYIIYILIDNWHGMNTSNVGFWWIWNDNKSSMIKTDLKLQFMKRHLCFQISFPKLWKWLSWRNRLENDNTMMKSQLHKENMDNKDERFIYKFQKTYGIMNVENHLMRCEDNMKMEETCLHVSSTPTLLTWGDDIWSFCTNLVCKKVFL